MKAKTITYERLVNTGNFTHEKYGIVIELEKDDQADDVIVEAKKFVERQLQRPTVQERAIAAQVNKFDDESDDLPF